MTDSLSPFSRQNGHVEDTVSPEVKVSPDPAMSSGLKSCQPPAGDAIVPAATVKRESDSSPTDSLGNSTATILLYSDNT